MPAAPTDLPWSSEPGSFHVRASTGVHQTTKMIRAESLSDAVAKARASFTHWPDTTQMQVTRQGGAETWRGTLA